MCGRLWESSLELESWGGGGGRGEGGGGGEREERGNGEALVCDQGCGLRCGVGGVTVE